MNMTRRTWLTLAVALVLTGTEAYAGGNGGTKKNSSIKVTINSTNSDFVQFAVAVDGDLAAFQKALNDKSTAEFTAAGGKILNAGGTTTFKVKAGNHRVLAAGILSDGDAVLADNSADGTLTVHVDSGKTKGVLVKDNGTGGITMVDP